MAGIEFPGVFAELRSTSGLSAETARQVFDAIFRGEWAPTQIAGLLVALHMRGESAAVVGSAARALRANMVPVEHSLPLVLDTCGTGGDGLGTINVSTGAAVIVAACGVPVAKHGNRAASSRSASAAVLHALGVSLGVPNLVLADLLQWNQQFAIDDESLIIEAVAIIVVVGLRTIHSGFRQS